MEAAAPPTGGGGGGGPAPFLLKTYEMVDDHSTDEIVSWSATNNSFVVWNPPEFARLLLPTYFKHNNFSSFIRQLNTYGFRKIDPEKWEFGNEDFVKDQKHLLKNIHRRKPIHSHSNPPGSAVDPERAALEEEIEGISRAKAQLEAKILNVKHQNAGKKLQLEELTQKIGNMNTRQNSLVSFFEKAVQNPTFVDNLAQKIESMDRSSYNKKRRVPEVSQSQSVENRFVDNQSNCRPEFSNIIHQDFSNKLRLELSPAVSDVNMVSHSTGSSTGGGSAASKISEPNDPRVRTEGLLLAPEPIELSDTGTSFAFKMNSSWLEKVATDDNSRLHLLQHDLNTNEDGDGLVSCHLNLSLASSPLQANKYSYSAREQEATQDIGKALDPGMNATNKECETNDTSKNRNLSDENTIVDSSKEVSKHNQGPPVNDVFWEQFLTERPGASDNEEASSNYRANSCEEHEDRGSNHGMVRNAKNMEQLTL